MTPVVRRYEHGSRVPGWDDAVDLTKAPAVVPDPATTPVPEALKRTIEEAMARYPDRRSAAADIFAAIPKSEQGIIKGLAQTHAAKFEGSLQDSMIDFGRIRFTIERYEEKLITYEQWQSRHFV